MHNFEWEDPRSDVVYGAMKWVARLRDVTRDPERKAKLEVILAGLVPPDLIGPLGLGNVAAKVQEATKLLAEKGLLPRALRSLTKWCLDEIADAVREHEKWAKREEARHAKTQ
jgi:hypothetical protein